MRGILECPCRERQITYQPDQWSQRLGDQCKRCHKPLCYQKCVSPCKCYLFAHDECFKSAFAKQIHHLNTVVNCLECSSQVRLSLKAEFSYDPNPTLAKLCRLVLVWIMLIVLVILILVTLGSGMKTQYLFFILYVEGLTLSLVLYWLILCLRDVLYRQDIVITEVGSTKLDIQTSAFQNIEMDTNNELAKESLQGVTI